MTIQQATTQREPSVAVRTCFWVIMMLGPFASIASWGWYGFAMLEAQTEQPKSLSAGTTMAGFGEVVGGIPLVIAHLVGVITLVVLGWMSYRGRGVALALVAVLISSLIGIGANQLVYGGELFELGTENDTFVP